MVPLYPLLFCWHYSAWLLAKQAVPNLPIARIESILNNGYE
jgi:hypothetical protein